MRLASGPARLEVAPDDGGRWAALSVDGLELLTDADIPGGHPSTLRGCFVMAPFAGRLREGRLQWQGAEHRLPLHAAPHAIHGTVVDRPWEVVDATGTSVELRQRLAPPWPFAGVVRQELVLGPDRLDARLVLESGEEQPVVLGYHPWFRRRLDRGGDAQVHLDAVRQYLRGDDGLPTGELVEPRAGPHDDCFLGVRSAPRVVWPGALELVLESPADHWVLFDERPEAVCVEPQTGPPDAVRLGRADVVPAGGSLELRLGLRWHLPAERS